MNLQKRFEVIWAARRLGMSVKEYRHYLRKLTFLKMIGDQIKEMTELEATEPRWSYERGMIWAEHLSWAKHCRSHYEFVQKVSMELADKYKAETEEQWDKFAEIYQSSWDLRR